MQPSPCNALWASWASETLYYTAQQTSRSYVGQRCKTQSSTYTRRDNIAEF